ncbi:VWA domain-containing protein [Spirosoma luteolum]
MFLSFFLLLRQHALPVSIPEYLTMLAALRSRVTVSRIDDFYALSKTILIKHEQHLDLFDRLFEQFVREQPTTPLSLLPELPPNWLRAAFEQEAGTPEWTDIAAQGGLDRLWADLRQLLDESGPESAGEGNRPGAGTSLLDAMRGDTAEPVDSTGGRQQEGKLWESRAYRNYDDTLELNTRNLKMALRRLRMLTREGPATELDLASTIEQTTRNAGLLDIRMRPPRHNRVKVLMLFDVGGSMDDHIDLCAQLFSAARYQFKQLDFLYFHNCVYDRLWRDNSRRREQVSTFEVLHKYGRDYNVIFVGDASMSPYELTMPQGSVEHYNEEAGLVWLDRFRQHFPRLVWLNPFTAGYWQYTPSIQLVRDWSGNRMFPLTLSGLEQAMKSLVNPKVVFTG